LADKYEFVQKQGNLSLFGLFYRERVESANGFDSLLARWLQFEGDFGIIVALKGLVV
jgi:hypothetical protein